MAQEVVFKRVLLKISGEALAGPTGVGLDAATIHTFAKEIALVHQAGVQTTIVVGGGNIARGDTLSTNSAIDRTVADQMGMLGTIINALALQAALEHIGIPTRVQSAINIAEVAEAFIRRRAIRHLEKGRAVIFAGGTGNPYFTTDTAAVLRALEVEAECLLKATKVNGIYDKDPMRFEDAIKYDHLNYSEAIEKRLAVMDQTAFTMCREHQLPIIVLNVHNPSAMLRAVQGEKIGTYVGGK